MAVRFKFAPSLGVFGLYTVPTPDSTDDSPLTDPLNNLSRVIVHPALRYHGVIRTITGTLSLPGGTSNGTTMVRNTHVLGAHGESGMPMIVGLIHNIGVGGVSVPWAGTVCVQCPVVNYIGGAQKDIQASRWMSLGVSGSNIVAYEVFRSAVATGPVAINLSYTVYVISRDLTAAPQVTGPSRMRVSGNAFLIETPKGVISSEHKYLKNKTGAGSFPLSGGRTTTIQYNYQVGTSIIKRTTFKHSFGPSIYEQNADYVPGPNNTWVFSPAAAVSPNIITAML